MNMRQHTTTGRIHDFAYGYKLPDILSGAFKVNGVSVTFQVFTLDACEKMLRLVIEACQSNARYTVAYETLSTGENGLVSMEKQIGDN